MPSSSSDKIILSEYDIFRNSNNIIIDYAVIVSPHRLEIYLKKNVLIKQEDINFFYYDYFTSATGNNFNLKSFAKPFFTQFGKMLVFENRPLDFSKNYVIEIKGEKTNLVFDAKTGGILDTIFDASHVQGLGISFHGNSAVFKVWSPSAGRIVLKLFDENQEPVSVKSSLDLRRGPQGLWAIELLPSDLLNTETFDGLYYQYEVYAYGKKKMALDPYTKSMASFNPSGNDKIGKGAIISFRNEKIQKSNSSIVFKNGNNIANPVDVVAYEIHVRDFTIQPGLLDSHIAGTFEGFKEKVSYLKSLGITHVQLLPVTKCYTVNDTDRSYNGTEKKEINYNWGYDTHNYFTLQGWFSTNSDCPYTRIKEFRELVQSLHEQGIGVIMDVVYNHTYCAEIFENIAPGCYYRFNPSLKISETTGAGPSLESRRKMVRKLIIDSLKYFVEEFQVDGFRFDLMCFMDHETMRCIRQEVGRAYNPLDRNDLILQGEAWNFTDIEDIENNPAITKYKFPENISLGIFNDGVRDAYAGRDINTGFAHGNYFTFDTVIAGITGAIKNFRDDSPVVSNHAFTNPYNSFALSPENCLNFLTVHDGFTLWDKINLSVKETTGLLRARIMRMATAMLFTSQGKIILHGGDEILRTKPLSENDKEKNRAHTSDFVSEEEGVKFFHENSYCSPDFTNMIRWNRLSNKYAGIANEMVLYYKGLIEMRRNIPAFRYSKTENILKGLRFVNGIKPTVFKSFIDPELDFLKIKFINGPAKNNLFLIGEIHPKGTPANPAANNFIVNFDAKGSAEIKFSKDQIERFDFTKRGQGNGLNIKLVHEPGIEKTLPESYSEDGSNLIPFSAISENKDVTIDLSVKNYIACQNNYIPGFCIAFSLDNTLENSITKKFSGTEYSRLIVYFNAAKTPVKFYSEAVINPEKWNVILDDHNAGIKALEYIETETSLQGKTNVLIEKQFVTVPGQSCAVIAF